MNIPVSPWALLSQTHFKVLPSVRQDLNHWRSQAEQIPIQSYGSKRSQVLKPNSSIVKADQSMDCWQRKTGGRRFDLLWRIKPLATTWIICVIVVVRSILKIFGHCMTPFFTHSLPTQNCRTTIGFVKIKMMAVISKFSQNLSNRFIEHPELCKDCSNPA